MRTEGLEQLNDLRRRYSSSRADLAAEFFTPCLQRSVCYERAVGFFSSTFYAFVDAPIADFANRGGHMRLICCPHLSVADIDAVALGYEQREVLAATLAEDMQECLTTTSGSAGLRLLATLLAHEVLDLKIAFRPGTRGIYHDKVGIFTDSAGNQVSFDGSINESWSAWSGMANHEAFHAFSSWLDQDRVDDDVEYFKALWGGTEPGVLVEEFPVIARDRLLAYADPEGLAHAEEVFRAEILAGTADTRRRPTLREHQKLVLADWNASGRRGIVEHATGSGKTITALSAAALALAEGASVVIVVPSIALLDQWRREAEAFLGPEHDVILAGGGHDEWQAGSTLRTLLRPGGGRVVVVTIDTAADERFRSRIQDLDPLLLIVDELHNAGSPTRRRLLELPARWRLGLSATWERQGDPEGTALIEDYFERVLSPVYTLADAVRDKHLCPYRYVLHELALTETERLEWMRLTRQLGAAMGAARGSDSEPIRLLRIKRSRVLKQAEGKAPLAATILGEHYREGQAWLVYCDDTTQLAAVRRHVEARGLRCFEYHRQVVGDESEALHEFERSGGIMLAIKCLDEGVDIPRIDHAIILASSTTRREFIQRRGRVLRRAKDKYIAEVHDVFVSASGFENESAATFQRTEGNRAREFLASAQDSAAANYLLNRLAPPDNDDQVDGEVTL